MKMKIVVVAAMAVAFTGMRAFGAEGKIGYVDVPKVMSQSETGKEASEQIASKVKKYQDDINAKQDELKKLAEEMEKQKMLLSDEKRNEKEKLYSKKLTELQRFKKDSEDELRGKDEELARKIISDLEKAVTDYGKKNGYVLILAKSDGIIYADEKGDLTEEVIKYLNSMRKK